MGIYLLERTEINIDKVISDAEKGILYWDYYDRWQKFKEEWSDEDRRRWNDLTGRMRKDVKGKRSLDPPLTDEEKTWAMDIIRRAMVWGFS
jgi:hypothetical protein